MKEYDIPTGRGQPGWLSVREFRAIALLVFKRTTGNWPTKQEWADFQAECKIAHEKAQ